MNFLRFFTSRMARQNVPAAPSATLTSHNGRLLDTLPTHDASDPLPLPGVSGSAHDEAEVSASEPAPATEQTPTLNAPTVQQNGSNMPSPEISSTPHATLSTLSSPSEFIPSARTKPFFDHRAGKVSQGARVTPKTGPNDKSSGHRNGVRDRRACDILRIKKAIGPHISRSAPLQKVMNTEPASGTIAGNRNQGKLISETVQIGSQRVSKLGKRTRSERAEDEEMVKRCKLDEEKPVEDIIAVKLAKMKVTLKCEADKRKSGRVTASSSPPEKLSTSMRRTIIRQGFVIKQNEDQLFELKAQKNILSGDVLQARKLAADNKQLLDLEICKTQKLGRELQEERRTVQELQSAVAKYGNIKDLKHDLELLRAELNRVQAEKEQILLDKEIAVADERRKTESVRAELEAYKAKIDLEKTELQLQRDKLDLEKTELQLQKDKLGVEREQLNSKNEKQEQQRQSCEPQRPSIQHAAEHSPSSLDVVDQSNASKDTQQSINNLIRNAADMESANVETGPETGPAAPPSQPASCEPQEESQLHSVSGLVAPQTDASGGSSAVGASSPLPVCQGYIAAANDGFVLSGYITDIESWIDDMKKKVLDTPRNQNDIEPDLQLWLDNLAADNQEHADAHDAEWLSRFGRKMSGSGPAGRRTPTETTVQALNSGEFTEEDEKAHFSLRNSMTWLTLNHFPYAYLYLKDEDMDICAHQLQWMCFMPKRAPEGRNRGFDWWQRPVHVNGVRLNGDILRARKAEELALLTRQPVPNEALVSTRERTTYLHQLFSSHYSAGTLSSSSLPRDVPALAAYADKNGRFSFGQSTTPVEWPSLEPGKLSPFLRSPFQMSPFAQSHESSLKVQELKGREQKGASSNQNQPLTQTKAGPYHGNTESSIPGKLRAFNTKLGKYAVTPPDKNATVSNKRGQTAVLPEKPKSLDSSHPMGPDQPKTTRKVTHKGTDFEHKVSAPLVQVPITYLSTHQPPLGWGTLPRNPFLAGDAAPQTEYRKRRREEATSVRQESGELDDRKLNGDYDALEEVSDTDATSAGKRRRSQSGYQRAFERNANRQRPTPRGNNRTQGQRRRPRPNTDEIARYLSGNTLRGAGAQQGARQADQMMIDEEIYPSFEAQAVQHVGSRTQLREFDPDNVRMADGDERSDEHMDIDVDENDIRPVDAVTVPDVVAASISNTHNIQSLPTNETASATPIAQDEESTSMSAEAIIVDDVSRPTNEPACTPPIAQDEESTSMSAEAIVVDDVSQPSTATPNDHNQFAKQFGVERFPAYIGSVNQPSARPKAAEPYYESPMRHMVLDEDYDDPDPDEEEIKAKLKTCDLNKNDTSNDAGKDLMDCLETMQSGSQASGSIVDTASRHHNATNPGASSVGPKSGHKSTAAKSTTLKLPTGTLSSLSKKTSTSMPTKFEGAQFTKTQEQLKTEAAAARADTMEAAEDLIAAARAAADKAIAEAAVVDDLSSHFESSQRLGAPVKTEAEMRAERRAEMAAIDAAIQRVNEQYAENRKVVESLKSARRH